MIVPSPDRLENRVGSKYALVIVAAKRARQLKEGAPPLVRSGSANPLTVALEEVAGGKVIPVEPEDAPAGESY
jgi:DNA-directed RNA polymerase subunit omega